MKFKPREYIILGIDTGTKIMGFGLIKGRGPNIEFLGVDELLIQKSYNHNLKLKKIFEKSLEIIDRYIPDELAIEEPFLGRNIQSMLKLSRAQGVAIAAAIYKNIPITAYSTRKIKISITGNGNSSKEQVICMLKYILGVNKFTSRNLDASDGLAAAVCHYINLNVYMRMRNPNTDF
ncbi:MAG: crossover junction endodeoxyribonuclease RuvC [Candidatus Walczuchella monophlebidarum]